MNIRTWDEMSRKERIWHLFEKQRGKCAYCGKLMISAWHMDHKVPRMKGGHLGEDNICLACPSCNSRKNVLNAEWFAKMIKAEKLSTTIKIL